MKSLLGIVILCLFSACSSVWKSSEAKAAKKSVLSVKVSREDAKDSCEAVAIVKGTYLGLKPNRIKALEDMRQKAFDKGANFVRLDLQSEAGTTAQGMAFKCPEPK